MTSHVLQGSLPFPDRLSGAVRGEFVRTAGLTEQVSVFGFDTVTSTMNVASAVTSGELPLKQLERFRICGSGDVLVFTALAQTQGRGRKQRAWLSKEGRGLYVTYVFHTGPAAASLGGLSLALGLAVQERMAAPGVETSLKWPNDLFARREGAGEPRKLSGILVEVGQSALRPELRAVHAGIGVNLGIQDFPPEVAAVSLEELVGSPPRYEEVLTGVTESITDTAARFLETGFAPFAGVWNARSGQSGKQVTVEGPDEVRRTGTVVGVRDDGALLLKDGETGDIVAVYSGEIV